MFTIGIDCGSRMTKLCLFDLEGSLIKDTIIMDSNENHEELFSQMIDIVLKKNDLTKDKILYVNTTGYGRKNFSGARRTVSEIISHAKGVNYFNPQIKTIIDIGGQDTKIIKITDKGKVLDFVMNDKCAAGTGRFLEKVADFFKLDIAELGEIALKSYIQLEISSTCVVFAESEIINLITSGHKREDIINAVHFSIINRILSMSGQIQIEFPLAFVGRVAKNIGMVNAMKKSLENFIYVPPIPEMTGAVGVAIC